MLGTGLDVRERPRCQEQASTSGTDLDVSDRSRCWGQASTLRTGLDVEDRPRCQGQAPTSGTGPVAGPRRGGRKHRGSTRSRTNVLRPDRAVVGSMSGWAWSATTVLRPARECGPASSSSSRGTSAWSARGRSPAGRALRSGGRSLRSPRTSPGCSSAA